MSKRRVGRPSSYKAYSDYYDKVAREMAAKGREMADSKYNEDEWAHAHQALTNDRKEDMKLRGRKKVGNVNRDLVNNQRWKLSEDQARARMEAAKRTPFSETGKVNIWDIRSGKVDPVDWDIIDSYRTIKKAEGLDNATVRRLISQEFFGSQ